MGEFVVTDWASEERAVLADLHIEVPEEVPFEPFHSRSIHDSDYIK